MMQKKDTVTSLLKEAAVLFNRILAGEIPSGTELAIRTTQAFLDRANATLAVNAEKFGRVRQVALDRGLCGKPKKFDTETRAKIGLEAGTLAARATKYNLSIETVRKYQKEAKAANENQG